MVPSVHTSIKEGAVLNLDCLYIIRPKDIASYLQVPYKKAKLSCLDKIHEQERIDRHWRNSQQGLKEKGDRKIHYKWK